MGDNKSEKMFGYLNRTDRFHNVTFRPRALQSVSFISHTATQVNIVTKRGALSQFYQFSAKLLTKYY